MWESHYFLCFVSAATSRDAVDLGYRTVVIDDACRGVTEEAITKAKSQLQQFGALILQSNDVSLFVLEEFELAAICYHHIFQIPSSFQWKQS